MSMQRPKHLSVLMLIALITGNMIGSGIFLLPSSIAQYGSIGLVSWLITAVGAILLALIFIRMSQRMPIKSGGPYLYVQKSLGDFMGFQTAFNYWIGIWVGNAAVCIATMGYLSFFIPLLSDPFYRTAGALLILWLLTFLNIFGVREAGWFQLWTTVLKLVPLAIVILLGWQYFHLEYITENFNHSNVSDLSALSSCAALTVWAFIGIESATVTTEHAANPRRDIPLATIIGTLITVAVYVLSSTVIMGMLPTEQLANSNAPFAEAATIILGPWGASLIAAGAVISCIGSLNGWVMLQGQICLATAQDKLFPNLLERVTKRGTPAHALVLSSTCASIVLLLSSSPSLIQQFDALILMAGFAFILPYLYTCSAYWLTSKNNFNDLTLAVLGTLYTLWMLRSTGHQAILYGCFVLLLTPTIFTVLRRRSKPS